ncbi:MAG TPA: hypothetical protein VKN99_03360 [Polyangia bacterium]|nr:hypothetical protein [Polyangia bacterium]
MALACLLAVGGGRVARAADPTRLPTALEEGNPWDVFFSVGWRYENHLAKIKREYEQPGRTTNQIEIVRDLKYARTRNILNLRADFGILWDLSLFIEAPLVLNDDRSLSFDQDGPNCTYTGPTANCVDMGNSTTLNDMASAPPNPNAPTVLPGALTPGTMGGWGLNATGSAPRLYTTGTKVFEGPTRSGLESLNFGLNWALLNQRKDDTKPTWTVGFEARLQVTGTQGFSRAAPQANTEVGLGYHVARWQSFVSKRFRYVDPYVGFWYELPVIHSSTAFPDYTQPGALGAASGTGQKNVSPMQTAGTVFGFEAVAYSKEREKQYVGIDFRGHIDAHFEGRGWSELWEVLACSKDDPDPFKSSLCYPPADLFGLPSLPGTTDIENYATAGGELGVTVQVGEYVHFRASFGADHMQSHTITFTDAGKDKNSDGMVDPTSKDEYNPLHRQQVDLVGRRYRVDDSTLYFVNVAGTLMF